MPLPRSTAVLLTLLVLAVGSAPVRPQETSTLEEAEQTVLETPAADRARQWLFALTEEPHVAGTPAEQRVAEYVRDRLVEFGLDTEMVRYDVFLNHPANVVLRIVEPIEMDLSLIETSHVVDKDSADPDLFPGFHGYGASGTARGQVVYANYGRPADFSRLESLGISVEGRIVLVRYGQVFRGLKVKEAEDRGAAGVIIYSDPADDGYMRGDLYPDGPMRPPSAIQRGSVQFLSIQPGDPSTPGYPSREDAVRVDRADMETVPHIPSLPLSYGEAEKLLRRLGGPGAPDGWQGGLPFRYHVGPGGVVAEMAVEMDEGLKPIFNVIARIEGTDEPDHLVVMGNHRDAWNHGAVDPNSGTAAFLETARALAAAIDGGWRPRRTILLASWDAEEYGLVGSTEWAEDQAERLGGRTVAYLNVDSAVTGREFDAGGSPSLRDVVVAAARAVPEPLEGGTVGSVWEARERSDWAGETVDLSAPEATFELHLDPLGSGSDYTAFLDHLGIPSVDLGFSGPYGVYHSAFDTFYWMDEFGDPRFVYHAAAARFYGLLGLRLASEAVVPLRFGSYGRALTGPLDDLRRQAIQLARGASNGEVPTLDFTEVQAALSRLTEAGTRLDRALDSVPVGSAGQPGLNRALIDIERAFLSEDGLVNRPWFKHLLYAPGLTTGYAAWPFPEMAEALENEDVTLFQSGASRVVQAIDEAVRRMDEAASLAR